MITPNPSGYFITGSDTDVGKTYVACELIEQLHQQQVNIEVRKPAESGCHTDSTEQLIAADAIKLQSANKNRERLENIVRFRFKAALAPHRAARLEGRQLQLPDLVSACTPLDANSLLIVEGAGGFYSPLAEDGLNANLAQALELPVIIVINDKIGAVNQALMTIQAVESKGLAVAAIIMNEVELITERDMDNATDLKVYCDYPIFRCQHGKTLEPVFAAVTTIAEQPGEKVL